MTRGYAWVTEDDFDAKLRELAGAVDLLDIPGVYEIVREHLNNDVLAALRDDYEDAPHRGDVRGLSREVCTEVLYAAGIEVYDHEDIDTLREAVRVNLEDGTLNLWDLTSDV